MNISGIISDGQINIFGKDIQGEFTATCHEKDLPTPSLTYVWFWGSTEWFLWIKWLWLGMLFTFCKSQFGV